ncbi:MAG: hypothetical protein JSR33_08675, partial [Proteobacteria bacterium]|nr:hypothetical protein [Pseudomonadota bacterium]
MKSSKSFFLKGILFCLAFFTLNTFADNPLPNNKPAYSLAPMLEKVTPGVVKINIEKEN